MILGETGSGKTTLLNAFVNMLWGVQYDDTYRYKLVHAETDDPMTIS